MSHHRHHHHDHDHHEHGASRLTIFTPAGVVLKAAPLKKAAKRLAAMGFEVSIDDDALAKHQRFGGDDDTRLAAIHRIAKQAPDIALAARGGYGLTRLLDRLDWKLLAHGVEHGTRWVGHSDMTAFQLGLLAHTGQRSWAGPLAVGDFGGDEVDDITQDCFVEAMTGALEAVGFRTEAGFDGLQAKGVLWGATSACSTACSARHTGPRSRAASCSWRT